MSEFNSIIANIPGSSDQTEIQKKVKNLKNYWMPRIVQITDKYLGKGKKVSHVIETKFRSIILIVDDLKEPY